MTNLSCYTKSLSRAAYLPLLLVVIASCGDDATTPAPGADAAADGDAAADAATPVHTSRPDGGSTPSSTPPDASPAATASGALGADGSIPIADAASSSEPSATTSLEPDSSLGSDAATSSVIPDGSDGSIEMDSSTDVDAAPPVSTSAPSGVTTGSASATAPSTTASASGTAVPPTCTPSGTCADGNGLDCADGEEVTRDCSGCALLAACGGVSCCDQVSNYGAVTYPDFVIQADLVTDFSQSGSLVTLGAEFTDQNQAAAILFVLSQSVAIDLGSLLLDVDVVGGQALTISLEDGTGNAGCLYQTDSDVTGTTIDLNSEPLCWGGFAADSPVAQINVRVDSVGYGTSDVSVHSLDWDEPSIVPQVCSDNCYYDNDGYCDDGGPNSVTDWCAYGNDCTDCGSRDEPPAECNDTCLGFHNDGYCDDGGSGSITAYCTLGSDCSDCGSR